MIATLIYALYWLAEGGIDRITQICNKPQNGFLLITNSWFVIAIAVFYLIFYFSFNWCKGNYHWGIRRTIIDVCLYIVFAYLIGLGGWWFYSSFAFIVGMIWKENETKINQIIKKHYLMFVSGWVCVLCLGQLIRMLNSKTIHSIILYDIAFLIASAAFVGIVFSFFKKITIKSKLWNFLGSISFEVYLLHELVYNVLRNETLGIYINYDFLYVALVIIITVCFACIFNIIVTKRIVKHVLMSNRNSSI